jgi:glycosyltransferase involved in cell wall biosynthesis
VQLRIAGKGPEEEELRAVAQSATNVVFLGHLGPDELERERARAWATLVPSRWYENAPMSVIESWWAGRPVLGSGHGGLAEMIGDGEAGWVVEPTVDGWIRAFGRMQHEAQALRDLGHSARARAMRDHDFGRLVEKVLEVYEAAIGDADG